MPKAEGCSVLTCTTMHASRGLWSGQAAWTFPVQSSTPASMTASPSGILSDTFLGRTFEDPVFTLVGRYGWARIDDDADAGTGDNEEERWTLGINYRPVESWVMKLEYQWNETENEALERGNNDGWFWSVAMGF